MAQYPPNYTWIMSQFKNVIDAHQAFGKALHEAGPIDEKHAQLIQLAGAAASRSEGAVHSHINRALAAGAQPDEIYHALVLLSSTIGFPNAAAALAWAKDVIDAGND
jgi:alkylhydroperoxidase/carboxymuconolactone decarboxylase family protein YurZ